MNRIYEEIRALKHSDIADKELKIVDLFYQADCNPASFSDLELIEKINLNEIVLICLRELDMYDDLFRLFQKQMDLIKATEGQLEGLNNRAVFYYQLLIAIYIVRKNKLSEYMALKLFFEFKGKGREFSKRFKFVRDHIYAYFFAMFYFVFIVFEFLLYIKEVPFTLLVFMLFVVLWISSYPHINKILKRLIFIVVDGVASTTYPNKIRIIFFPKNYKLPSTPKSSNK